jgi:hypothetical protein
MKSLSSATPVTKQTYEKLGRIPEGIATLRLAKITATFAL